MSQWRIWALLGGGGGEEREGGTGISYVGRKCDYLFLGRCWGGQFAPCPPPY